jgi:hypothetical protein
MPKKDRQAGIDYFDNCIPRQSTICHFISISLTIKVKGVHEVSANVMVNKPDTIVHVSVTWPASTERQPAHLSKRSPQSNIRSSNLSPTISSSFYLVYWHSTALLIYSSIHSVDDDDPEIDGPDGVIGHTAPSRPRKVYCDLTW